MKEKVPRDNLLSSSGLFCQQGFPFVFTKSEKFISFVEVGTPWCKNDMVGLC